MTTQTIQAWVEKNLAEAEKDTSNYVSIEMSKETTFYHHETSWHFDKNFLIKFYQSTIEEGGTSTYSYYFEQGKLAGGCEVVSTDDSDDHVFFINTNMTGFSKQEDIFSDTIMYLTAEDLLAKTRNFENEKELLITYLAEMAAFESTEDDQNIVIEITQARANEDEKVKYVISKELFNALIRPAGN